MSGAAVNSAEDVTKAITEAEKLGRKTVVIRVKSGDQSRFLAVQLKKAG